MNTQHALIIGAISSLMAACQPAKNEMSHVTLEEVISTGKSIRADFWEGFTPVASEELDRLERDLGIALPPDLREFYLKVGCGHGPPPAGGGIHSPEALRKECYTSIFFVTGSMTPGKEWASKQEHEDLWKSNGLKNPDPDEFTDDVMDFHGVPLWHLLDIGYNGSGVALNVYTGSDSPPFKFCAIVESELYYTADSFLEGMLKNLKEELGIDPSLDE